MAQKGDGKGAGRAAKQGAGKAAKRDWLDKKVYEKELARLQVELVKM